MTCLLAEIDCRGFGTKCDCRSYWPDETKWKIYKIADGYDNEICEFSDCGKIVGCIFAPCRYYDSLSEEIYSCVGCMNNITRILPIFISIRDWLATQMNYDIANVILLKFIELKTED